MRQAIPVVTQPSVTPSITEQELETLPKWARDLIRTFSINCEMWQTIANRREAENANQTGKIAALKIDIDRFQSRIEQLEKQLRQISNNSSKPSSSDPLYKARKLFSKGRSKKKPGG